MTVGPMAEFIKAPRKLNMEPLVGTPNQTDFSMVADDGQSTTIAYDEPSNTSASVANSIFNTTWKSDKNNHKRNTTANSETTPTHAARNSKH